MTNTIRRPLDVPYAMDRPDRVPAPRYFDPEFFAMENELLWPRVWQMATRLEHIPNPGDYVEYEILDRSVVVVRVDATTIKAYENTCRHRGVKLASGSGNLPSGFTCPFHGWCWGLNGENTFLYQPDLFDESQRDQDDLRLREVRVETAAGCAFINFDKNAPPLKDSIEPWGSFHENEFKAGDLREEWWLACALPTNWKLAMEAFMEGYHVMETHPQLMPPGYKQSAGANAVYRDLSTIGKTQTVPAGVVTSSREFIDAQIEYLRLVSVGMAGMVHEDVIDVAGTLRDLDLSADPANASANFMRSLGQAVVDWHESRGEQMPDLATLAEKNMAIGVNFCFPHYFILPGFSSASAYRIRPLTPETCLFELWSLNRYPPGQEPALPPKPVPMAANDPRWPPIPAQDYSNLPLQQAALHSPGFEFMRLSDKVEGMIGNYHRLIDGYLAGLGYDQLLPAVQQVSGPIDMPSRDIGF